MSNVLLIIGSALIAIAAVIHVYIFVLESITWSRPSTWKIFGFRSQADAETAKPLAFNQGFYNLFLALGAAAGLVLLAVPATVQAGLATTLFAAASMVLAAAVLIVSSPALARAAVIQGAAPLLGVAAILLSQAL